MEKKWTHFKYFHRSRDYWQDKREADIKMRNVWDKLLMTLIRLKLKRHFYE